MPRPKVFVSWLVGGIIAEGIVIGIGELACDGHPSPYWFMPLSLVLGVLWGTVGIAVGKVLSDS